MVAMSRFNDNVVLRLISSLCYFCFNEIKLINLKFISHIILAEQLIGATHISAHVCPNSVRLSSLLVLTTTLYTVLESEVG